MLDAGHLLDNRYRLDERIATGGMGDVWRGTDVVLGRTVAVKVLKSSMMSDPEFAARFYGEARMMAAFRHPGVVEVYDYASAGDSHDDDQCAYLVMAYVEGEPLSTRLKEAGRLPVDETMSIVAQVADALHAAHQNGTVHRDVKPGNLIVKPSGAVILVDFGVARSTAVTSLTGVNSIVGTALYMAPEQVAKGNVTPATDIYALGAVAYHCVAGHPPFDGDNALQVALRHLDEDPPPLPPDVPVPVRELIGRAMAKRPEDRFASAAEFAAAALAAGPAMDYRALTGTALTAPLSPAPPTRAVPAPTDLPLAPAPPGRRKRSSAELAVLVAVILLGLAAAGLAAALFLAPDPDNGGTGADPSAPPAAEASESTAAEVPVAPTSAAATRDPAPNGQTRQTTPTRTTRPPASAPPATTPPTTQPTTQPPTEPTEEEPTEPATEDPGSPPADGGGGDGAGTGGA
ncbi:MAG TPA: serine/threonine-protein kinase [Actinoplanes sp.]|nr:serine/threonine-protein kinase [Actinoplanes sp.]